MIIYSCDVCKKTVEREYVSNRLIRNKGRVTIEVMVAVDETWNKGDVCLDCLLDVMNNGTEPKGRKVYGVR